ncbi:MAG: hypothetical protein KKG67_20525 [Gammaproteobacteria bacterium]|nr:hypothetical protein [Gammaproteobacteria bacterium]
MDEVKNAFQAVRPRGENLPSAVPVPANVGRAPMALPGSGPRVMDRNGKFNAPLAPRAYGSIVVEGQAQGQASTDKRKALVRGGL